MNDTSTKVKKAILVFGDIIVLYVSLGLTLYIRYWPNGSIGHWHDHLIPFSVIYGTWILIFLAYGLYELNLAKNTIFFYSTLFRAMALNAVVAILFFYLIPFFGITPKTNLLINMVILLLLIYLWRQLFNKLIKSKALLNNVLVIGKNKEAKQLIKYVNDNPQLGYRIKQKISEKQTRLVANLVEIVVQKKIQTIVTVPDPRQDGILVKNLYHCLPLKVTLFDLPRFYERIIGKVPISIIEEVWFLENLMNSRKNIYGFFKRGADIVLALAIGIVTLPLYPLIALVIKLDSPGPVFYHQRRVGQDSIIFEIVKFRSMVKDAEKKGAQWATKNDPRITRIGNFLRKTRIDELPQLWNVVKGEMSFVGPRPERPEFVFSAEMQKEVPFYQIRHLAKPGLTGWAQINFDYGSSYEDTLQKLQYDFYYLKNRSFLLDLSVILKTAKIILSREGR